MVETGTPSVQDMSPEQIASFQYQQENYNDDQRGPVLGTIWSLWVVAVIALVLRFRAKSIMHGKFKLEDILILLGMFFATGLNIHTTVGTYFGLGFHAVRAGEAHLIVSAKILLSFQLTYNFAITFTKFSILTFYYRTFSLNQHFRMFVKCVGAIVFLWFLTTTFTCLVQCIPLTYLWNKNQPGRCINFEAFIIATAIVNIITDFVIVAMPAPVIWKLHVPRNRKIALCGIFLLGAVVVLASIVRAVHLHKVDTFDLTYDTIEIAIWSAAEPFLGIVGACLPLMVPVFRKIRVMSTKKSSGGVNSGHGWSHKRLEGGQIAASQPAWNKENVALTDQKEVLSFAIHKENVPSTNDKEWTDGGSNEGDRRQSSLQPEFVIRAPPRPFYG